MKRHNERGVKYNQQAPEYEGFGSGEGTYYGDCIREGRSWVKSVGWWSSKGRLDFRRVKIIETRRGNCHPSGVSV